MNFPGLLLLFGEPIFGMVPNVADYKAPTVAGFAFSNNDYGVTLECSGNNWAGNGEVCV